VLWDRIWERTGEFSLTVLVLVALLPVIGGIAGTLVVAVTPERYTAHSYVLVTSTGGEGADVSAVSVAQAIARVATNESVLDAGARGDRLRTATREGAFTATASPDAPLVDLSATASTASDAVTLADELALQVVEHVTAFRGAAKVRAEIFASASPPDAPSSPNPVVSVVAGAALGALIAAAVLILRRP
jgi:capsular polysaccharide biosynthesis protein